MFYNRWERAQCDLADEGHGENIRVVQWRGGYRELSNNNREQSWPSKCASSLSSSPHLLLFVLSPFFSCFIFTVEYTWCSLSIAWVTIDFSSLCSLVGCLTQEFSDTQGFVVALWSFSTSSVRPSYPYITKTSYRFRTAYLSGCPMNVVCTGSSLEPHRSGMTFHWSSRTLTAVFYKVRKISQSFILELLRNPCILNILKIQTQSNRV